MLQMQAGDAKSRETPGLIRPSLYKTAYASSALFFGAGVITQVPLSEIAQSALTMALYSLLSGAEERQRLEANTFKLMGAGVGLTAALSLSVQTRAWQRLCSVVYLLVSLFQLRRFGLPELRIEWVGSSGTARGYLLTAAPCLFVAGSTIPSAIPFCLAAHLALHGAATVGAKRLASETYQRLNDIVMATQALACIIVSLSQTTTVQDVAKVFFAGLPVLAACIRGKALGLSYTNANTASTK